MPTDLSKITPGSLGAWKLAYRPATLWIATAPVVSASALVYGTNQIAPMPLWELIATIVLAMLCSILIQAITNLQNDVGYVEMGYEKPGNRPGMPRVTQLGLLTKRQVKTAIAITSLVTLALGAPLVYWHGWIVLLLGVASIAAAILYMAGKHPIAFTAYGEVCVFIFFGLIAVNGTVFLLSHTMTVGGLMLSVMIGFLASAVLLVNNYRDIEHDAELGRKTLPVALGATGSKRMFGFLVFAPFVILLAFACQWLLPAKASLLFYFPLLALPSAFRVFFSFLRTPPSPAFNAILFKTVRLEALFAGLFTIGALLNGPLVRTMI